MTTGNRIAKILLNSLFLICPALLFYAPFYHGDYSYYEILRTVVFLFAGWLALITTLHQDGYFANPNSKYPIIFGIIAVLFNPIFPIHLSREIWAPIDIIAGIFFLIYFVERKISHKTNKEIANEQAEIDKKQDEEYNRLKNLQWCKTCLYYKKNRAYKDSLTGTWLNKTLPQIEKLPCSIAAQAIETWQKYYETPVKERTLYPNNCKLYHHK